MKIVVNMQVGNEVELIEQHIAYHLALGVDGFVIADMDSVDGTSDRLDRYRNNPQFVIRKFDLGDLIDATGPRTDEVGHWMLQATRDHFAPDWVIRLDADEFVYSEHDLASTIGALSSQPWFRIERRNIVFGQGQPIPPIPVTKDALAELRIVARPFKTTPASYRADDSLPLILTEVGPKVMVRPDKVLSYTTGGHGAVDLQGNTLVAPLADGILLVHFWFTTAQRFVRKARFTAFVEDMLRPHPQAVKGWQWTRWAEIAGPGDSASTAAILAEYSRQFPGADTVDHLRYLGHVCRVSEYWSR